MTEPGGAAAPEVNEAIAGWRDAFFASDWEARYAPSAAALRRRVVYRCGKRAFDIVVSGLALLVFALPLAVLALIVRLDSPGPVFFRQQRMTRGVRPFHILKFRTMRVDAEKLGPGITVGRDTRITRSGAWLRASKLDELPQLWNVLVGHMSLVGSRPELPRYVALYPEAYRVLLLTRPGITDLASLRFRDESELLASIAAEPEAAEQVYRGQLLPAKLWLSLSDRDERAGWRHELALILRTVGILPKPPSLIES